MSPALTPARAWCVISGEQLAAGGILDDAPDLAAGKFGDGVVGSLFEQQIAVGAQERQATVVYKVDRLTRSLADFAKLVELFEAHVESACVSFTRNRRPRR
jgi:hypothetical protein